MTARQQHWYKLAQELMADWHPDARHVTAQLLLHAPIGSRAQDVVLRYQQPLQSIRTRYERRGLPTPKQQLAVFRRLLLLEMRHDTAGMAAIALGFSSPQHVNRHLRQTTGLTWTRFRARYTPEEYWMRHVAAVLQWSDPRWASAAVLTATRGCA